MSEFLTKFSKLKGAAEGAAKLDPKFAEDPKAAADFAEAQLRELNAFDLIEKVAEHPSGNEGDLAAISSDIEDIRNDLRQLRQTLSSK